MLKACPASSPRHVVIVMPLRDDWVSAETLIRALDNTLTAHSCTFEVLLVDDNSSEECRPADFGHSFSAIRAIRVLRLRRNLGHQRAIAIGLAYIHRTIGCDAVVVMDSDGEDTPGGVEQLLSVYSEKGGAMAVFAERARRSESLVFKFFYHIYRGIHYALTGVSVRVGNFSILPSAYLNSITVMSELWNHYAAAVFRSRLSYTMVPVARGSRIAGTSKMNFVGLVTHGLSAISVFGDIVGARLLILSLGASLLSILGIVIVVAIRLFTHLAIPGWTTYAAGTLAVIAMQGLTIATSFTFFVLSNRSNAGFVPLRDSLMFVADEIGVYP